MTKYEIEHEDAPSGLVTFYNYKEPLMKFTEGYGYVGALLFDAVDDSVQCHLCGEWNKYLPNHLHKEHNMSASYYKEKVGLLKNTALISETTRAKLIEKGLERFKNLRPGIKKTEIEKKKIAKTLKENGEKPENMNLRGTCPAQLLDRLKKKYQEEGEKFAFRNHSNLQFMLRKTFGSVKEACQLAEVPYRIPGKNLNYKHVAKYSEQDAQNFVTEFIRQFDKTPTFKDFISQEKKGLYTSKVINSKKLRKLISNAYLNMGEYVKPKIRLNYSKEDLLDFLRKFEKNNGRRPSISDGKRCLIPYPSRYIYHFGSWKNALSLAFENYEKPETN